MATNRILILDDDPGLRMTLQRILEANGYAPTAVATGKEAIAAVEEEPPVVALIDLKLEDMSGLQVMREIKVRSPATECIVLTGYASQAAAIEAVNLGAYSFVQKPYDAEHLLVTVRRVIEKQEADAALRESEAELAAIFRNAPVLMVVVDRERRVQKVNRAAVEFAGRPAEEMMGLRDGEALRCLHALDDPRGCGFGPSCATCMVRRTVLDTFETGRSHHQVEASLPFARGEKQEDLSLLVSTTPLTVSGSSMVLVCIEDITERVRAEQELRQLKEFNEDIVTSMAEGIVVQDASGTFTFVNPAAADLLGYAPEELVGQHWTAVIPPDQQPIVRAADERRARGQADRYELELVRKDGTRLTVLVSGSPRFERGRFAGSLAVFTDITERVRAEEQIRRLATQLKSIARPARQMSALLDPDELTQRVVQSLQEITGCYNANFFLREDDGLVLAAGQGGYEGGEPPLGYRLTPGQGIIGHAAQSGQPLLVPDVSQEPRYIAWEGLPHTRSELAIPVKHGDRVLGVIDMQAKEPEGFDTADLEALGVLADQLAVALQNARLYGETQRRASEMAALYETALDLATSGKLEEVLQLMARRTVALLQVRGAGTYLYDQDADELELTVAYGTGEEYIGTRLKPGEGLSGKVMQDRQPMVVDDYRTWEGRSPKFEVEPFTAVAAVPLLWQDQLIGVLNVVDDKERRTFGDDDVRLLTLLAQQAAAAIANARSLEAEQKRAAQLATINELGRALAATLDLPTVYHTAYQYVQRLVDCPYFGISLFDPEQRTITAAFMLEEGEELDLSQFPPLPYEPRARTGRSKAIAKGQPELVHDLLGACQQSDHEVYEIGEGPETLSALYMPMIVEGQVIGLLEVQSYRPGAYRHEDVELLTTAANQIGLAIQNARLFEQTRRRADETAALLATARAISSLDREAVLETIASQAKALFEADGSRIHLIEPDGETLRCVVALHERAEAALATRLKLGQGLTGHVALNGEPEIVNAALGDPRVMQMPGTPVEQEAMALAPLKVRGRVIGVMTVTRLEDERPFDPSDLALLTAFADQAAIALENARLFDETRQRLHELSALFKVSTALREAQTVEEMYPIILHETLQVMNTDSGAIALLDPAQQELEIVAALGWSQGVPLPRFGVENSILGRVVQRGQAYISPDLSQDLWTAPAARPFFRPGQSGAFLPLKGGAQTLGTLFVTSQELRLFTEDEVHLLTAIADMAGNAIQRASLHEQTVRQAQELAQALSELEETYRSTLTALTAALDARDRETEGHSRRVTELSLAIARAMGLRDQELATLERGAILHDVGKIGVLDAILRKPGRLSPEEWVEMKKHPEMGYQILKDVRFLNGSLPLIRHHHEWWNGQGYPMGLAGEAIPLGARIFAVADAYDAMTSDRHYRPTMSHEEAVAELRRCAGTQFDPAVVEAFLAILE